MPETALAGQDLVLSGCSIERTGTGRHSRAFAEPAI
jgi:hypothetical protein